MGRGNGGGAAARAWPLPLPPLHRMERGTGVRFAPVVGIGRSATCLALVSLFCALLPPATDLNWSNEKALALAGPGRGLARSGSSAGECRGDPPAGAVFAWRNLAGRSAHHQSLRAETAPGCGRRLAGIWGGITRRV